jgi:hypothetical protein
MHSTCVPCAGHQDPPEFFTEEAIPSIFFPEASLKTKTIPTASKSITIIAGNEISFMVYHQKGFGLFIL